MPYSDPEKQKEAELCRWQVHNSGRKRSAAAARSSRLAAQKRLGSIAPKTGRETRNGGSRQRAGRSVRSDSAGIVRPGVRVSPGLDGRGFPL